MRAIFWGWFGATAVQCAVPRCPESTNVAEAAAPQATTTTAAREPADAGSENPPALAATSDTTDGGADATRTDAGFRQGLSAEQVRTVVMGALGSFQGCYERVLVKEPELKGGITVVFSIATDGRVSSATVSSSSMGKPEVETCMAEEFRKLEFPAAEKPTHATFPFVFKGAK